MEEGQNYGHWQHDKMTSILGMPPEIVAKSYFMAFEPQQFVVESLELVGFHDRVIYLHPNERIQVDRLYTVDPYPFWVVAPNLLERWRELVVNKVGGLDKIFPTRFAFQNRNGSRVIANMTEIWHDIEKIFPLQKWEMLPLQYTSILEAAGVFNTLRLFFAPHGAGFTNYLFMQRKKAVICEIQKGRLGRFFFFTSAIFEIRHLYLILGGRIGAPGYIPLKKAIKMIELALSLINQPF
jgi:capsular polysaccharide biosynthesis protein